MKRTILCLLLAAQLAAASCGSGAGTSETTKETTAAPIQNDYLEELVTDDFRGRTFTILDATDFPGQVYNMPDEELAGDIINDGLAARNRLIEERFGITIAYEQSNSAEAGIDSMRASVLAGDDDYQLVISKLMGGALGSVATEGVLADLCDIDELSLESEWWSRLMYDKMQLGGRMYFTAGDISPEIYNTPYAVFFNTSLLDEYGIDTDLHALVDMGEWTIDALQALTMPYGEDINGDNVMHTNDDFFGIVYQSNTLAATGWTAGAGVDLSYVEAGTIKLGLSSELCVNTVEKLRTLTCGIRYDDHNDIYNKAFMSDRALAMIHIVSFGVDSLRKMESDYTILPMPKYDAAVDGYRSPVNAWANAFAAIPLTADEDFAGTVTEALCYVSWRDLRPDVYDLVLKQKSARDEASARMLDLIYDNLYLDFNSLYNFGGTTDILANAIFGGGELLSGISAVAEKAQAEIDALTDAWIGE